MPITIRGNIKYNSNESFKDDEISYHQFVVIKFAPIGPELSELKLSKAAISKLENDGPQEFYKVYGYYFVHKIEEQIIATIKVSMKVKENDSRSELSGELRGTFNVSLVNVTGGGSGEMTDTQK